MYNIIIMQYEYLHHNLYVRYIIKQLPWNFRCMLKLILNHYNQENWKEDHIWAIPRSSKTPGREKVPWWSWWAEENDYQADIRWLRPCCLWSNSECVCLCVHVLEFRFLIHTCQLQSVKIANCTLPYAVNIIVPQNVWSVDLEIGTGSPGMSTSTMVMFPLLK